MMGPQIPQEHWLEFAERLLFWLQKQWESQVTPIWLPAPCPKLADELDEKVKYGVS